MGTRESQRNYSHTKKRSSTPTMMQKAAIIRSQFFLSIMHVRCAFTPFNPITLLLIFYLTLFSLSWGKGGGLNMAIGGITATLGYRFVIENLLLRPATSCFPIIFSSCFWLVMRLSFWSISSMRMHVRLHSGKNSSRSPDSIQ